MGPRRAVPNVKYKLNLEDQLPFTFLRRKAKVVIEVKVHLFLLFIKKEYVQLHSHLLSTFIISKSALPAGTHT